MVTLNLLYKCVLFCHALMLKKGLLLWFRPLVYRMVKFFKNSEIGFLSKGSKRYLKKIVTKYIDISNIYIFLIQI
ncbi:Putative protein [Zobellia galactanivorans]|uniref:Uncharacterized protein n=1 Tax=Zobellia galactanivorans (strain DSM 12802 / CCUG 47099 / CIP 106680 / NCIMB 13871 / Dsij) TaxID=63186 RepID=G0L4N5_ZOBGA|nr:Putative protein [Zobellia galactanivorans]